MQFQALRTINGDYGHKNPGDVFSVPEDATTLRRMKELETKGLVTRYRPSPPRANYAVYENKALLAHDNKGRKRQ